MLQFQRRAASIFAMRQWDSNPDIGGEAVISVTAIGQEGEIPIAPPIQDRREGKRSDPVPVGRSTPDKILDRLVRKWGECPALVR